MSDTAERLYRLLPRYIQARDTEAGGPLLALLSVVAGQVDVLEGDIDQLYENWFIETCADWAVPYIAELVGHRPVHDAGEPGPGANREGRLLNAILIPRREVANTIHDRRRKGTLALVDQVAGDVSGWPARVVESYRLLGVTQGLNQPRPDRGRLVDLREVDALDRIGGPFDELAHSVDVRRPNSARTPGRYNIPSLLLFAWRLTALPITRAPALHLNHPPDRHEKHPSHAVYTVSSLGNDAPLYTLPRKLADPSRIPGELASPVPIRRRAFAERTADYYGPGKSLQVFLHTLDNLVPLPMIVPADLSDGPPPLRAGEVAVDPELGLISFLADPEARNRVWVSCYQGFGAPMGGGGYPRKLDPPGEGTKLYRVGGPAARPTGDGGRIFRRISDALDQWAADSSGSPPGAIIEIIDSDEYNEAIAVSVPIGVTLEIRSASGCRPLLRFRPKNPHESDLTEETEVIALYGEDADDDDLDPDQTAPGGRVVLDGLLVAGRYVEASGSLSELVIRDCTFVPGWSLSRDCRPTDPDRQSVRLVETSARLVVSRSILGPIEVVRTEIAAPVEVRIGDSILDAMGPDRDALASPDDCDVAHAALTVVRSTVLGAVRVHSLPLAENSIFAGAVRVARRQAGCVRFCYLPPKAETRTPARFECQPADPADDACVRPRFAGLRYGDPSFGRLADSCPVEILRGADDESEMGAFHDLFRTQREANLRARLDEYTPAGVNAGLFLQPGDDR